MRLRLPFRSLALLAMVAPLAACQMMTFKGDAYTDQPAMEANPPYSLAVLPSVDATSESLELMPTLRQALYSAVVALPYQDRELSFVDAKLAAIASRLGCCPQNLPEEAQASPEIADCVLFSRLEKIGRFYLILYSHNRVRLKITLVDTRTRKVLFRNTFTFVDPNASPSITLLGLVESSFRALWHLRETRFRETFEEAAVKIASELPVPPLELAAGSDLKLNSVTVEIPKPHLGPGDTVHVKVCGTPNCRSTFSIGKVAQDLPLIEFEPGVYEGYYSVKDGDDTPYAAVEVTLKPAVGDSALRYTENHQTFIIDTTPPPRAQVTEWWSPWADPGVYLKIGLDPEDSGKNHEIPDEYYVYRRERGETEFRMLGSTREGVFQDSAAGADKFYEYCVVTRDLAGNFSPMGKIVSVSTRSQ